MEKETSYTFYPDMSGPSAGQSATEGRELTTDELLARECNRYIDRRHQRQMLVLKAGLTIFIAGLILTLVMWTPHAKAHSSFAPAPLPYSCTQVKAAFAVMTREHLEKLAKELGITITPSQRREVAKCLARG